jgi:gluconokinase
MLTAGHHIVVMGVAGCGKTTIGQKLAEKLSMPFADGDDFHPAENIRKMSEGTPLDDDDRWPWLDRLNAVLKDAETNMVVSCSALREAYRSRIATGLDVTFVYLKVSEETVMERVRAREHFFPESLVRAQFEVLEEPQGGAVLVADAGQAVPEVLSDISLQLGLD